MLAFFFSAESIKKKVFLYIYLYCLQTSHMGRWEANHVLGERAIHSAEGAGVVFSLKNLRAAQIIALTLQSGAEDLSFEAWKISA